MQELKNSVILITRPAHQAKKLQEKIECLGGEVVLFPTIEITSHRNSRALRNSVEKICDYSGAIFASANAVEAVGDLWSSLNITIPAIAIGSGTANALGQYGISVAHIPDEFSSAGLLRLPTLNQIAGQKIAIFCGENPKPLLKETLIQRGALVTEILCYRRSLPLITQKEPLSEATRESITCIISLSCESLLNLFAIFGPEDWFLNKTLIVATSEMLECASEHGWKNRIIVAKNPSDEAIVESLLGVQ
jgi:uroporphyrinogen-III synthase